MASFSFNKNTLSQFLSTLITSLGFDLITPCLNDTDQPKPIKKDGERMCV